MIRLTLGATLCLLHLLGVSTLAQEQATDPSARSERSPISVRLDIFRLNGNRVSDADKSRQGSIVNIFDPGYTGEDPLAPPNNRIQMQLSWDRALAADEAAVIEITGPSTGQGTIRIYDGSALLKESSASTLVLDLGSWSSGKILSIEGVIAGIADLRFVVNVAGGGQNLAQDTVRVTGISDLPKAGRILFVNPDAVEHCAPYDSYVDNAAATIADAVQYVGPEDNIVISPAAYTEYGLEPRYSCVIAGVGGYYDDGIDTTHFNLYGATNVDAGGHGRVFRMAETPESTEIIITGLSLQNGVEWTGGIVLQDDSGGGILKVTCCALTSGMSIAPYPSEQLDLGGSGEGGEADMQVATAHADFAANSVPMLAAGGGGGGVGVRHKVDEDAAKEGFFARKDVFDSCQAASFGGAVALLRDDDPKPLAANLAGALNELNNLNRGFPLLYQKGGCGGFAAKLVECKFTNNVAPKGGALAAAPDSPSDKPWKRMTCGLPFWLEECVFEGNAASGGGRNRGGAINMWGANCGGSWVAGCTFRNNRALGPGAGNGDGGAIAVKFMATLWLSDHGGVRGLIEENSAADGGGGLYVTYFAAVRVTNHDIRKNVSSGGGGGAHVTSGSVLDIAGSVLDQNRGIDGGGVHNRNSRVDVRGTCITANKASGRGGGFYVTCTDDSGGQDFWGWLYPESAVNPAILRVTSSSEIVANSATIAGAIEMFRTANRAKDPYVTVADKILKLDTVDSLVDSNVATINDPSLGLVGGVALTGTDESAANRPQFNRNAYINNLQTALALSYGPVPRWPNDCGCTQAQAATYISNIMLWGGLTDAQLADDLIQNSTFRNNTNFQGSSAGSVMPAHLTKGGNAVTGAQSPPGLF